MASSSISESITLSKIQFNVSSLDNFAKKVKKANDLRRVCYLAYTLTEKHNLADMGIGVQLDRLNRIYDDIDLRDVDLYDMSDSITSDIHDEVVQMIEHYLLDKEYDNYMQIGSDYVDFLRAIDPLIG